MNRDDALDRVGINAVERAERGELFDPGPPYPPPPDPAAPGVRSYCSYRHGTTAWQGGGPCPFCATREDRDNLRRTIRAVLPLVTQAIGTRSLPQELEQRLVEWATRPHPFKAQDQCRKDGHGRTECVDCGAELVGLETVRERSAPEVPQHAPARGEDGQSPKIADSNGTSPPKGL